MTPSSSQQNHHHPHRVSHWIRQTGTRLLAGSPWSSVSSIAITSLTVRWRYPDRRTAGAAGALPRPLSSTCSPVSAIWFVWKAAGGWGAAAGCPVFRVDELPTQFSVRRCQQILHHQTFGLDSGDRSHRLAKAIVHAEMFPQRGLDRVFAEQARCWHFFRDR